MPLGPAEVDADERKQAGREAAIAAGASEPKEYGQTSESNHPYTYWWLVGWNEEVGAT